MNVNTGTLGGKGIITGPTTIGTGSGSGAFLAPAVGSTKQTTLTIQSALTLNADATYTYSFKARRNQSAPIWSLPTESRSTAPPWTWPARPSAA